MEEKTVEVKTPYAQEMIRRYGIFDYKCVNQVFLGVKTSLTFQRDETTPYYQEIVELEKKYTNFKIMPFWVIMFLPVMAMGLMIAFTIVMMTRGPVAEPSQFFKLFFAFFVPALSLIILTVVATIIYSSVLKKFQIKKDKELKEIEKQIAEIKAKY